jgi:hypothetical protein
VHRFLYIHTRNVQQDATLVSWFYCKMVELSTTVMWPAARTWTIFKRTLPQSSRSNVTYDVPVAVNCSYCTTDVGYGKYPKHVEWSCNKIKILVLHLIGHFVCVCLCSTVLLFLGAFANSNYYFLNVCPSAWNKSNPTGKIFMKLYNWVSWKSIEKIQLSLKSDKSTGYFTWSLTYIYESISFSSS